MIESNGKRDLGKFVLMARHDKLSLLLIIIILWDFVIQTDHLIPARRPELEIDDKQKQEKLPNSGLCDPSRPQREN